MWFIALWLGTLPHPQEASLPIAPLAPWAGAIFLISWEYTRPQSPNPKGTWTLEDKSWGSVLPGYPMWEFYTSPSQPWKMRPSVHERGSRLPYTHILEAVLCTPLERQPFSHNSCRGRGRGGAKAEKTTAMETRKRKGSGLRH